MIGVEVAEDDGDVAGVGNALQLTEDSRAAVHQYRLFTGNGEQITGARGARPAHTARAPEDRETHRPHCATIPRPGVGIRVTTARRSAVGTSDVLHGSDDRTEESVRELREEVRIARRLEDAGRVAARVRMQ